MAHSFHPHPIVGATKIFIMTILLSALVYLMRDVLERILFPLIAALWLIGIVFIMIAFIASRFQTLTLEENGMLYQSGILSTRRILLSYAKITETTYTQGLVQRLFGVGTLYVDTAGGSNVAIHMNDLKHSELKKNPARDKNEGWKRGRDLKIPSIPLVIAWLIWITSNTLKITWSSGKSRSY
ncbi:MAG: PH domain-containing protein [Candidatus Micrarchaeota archaeon]